MQPLEVLAQRRAERGGSLPHLERRKRVDVEVRYLVFDRANDGGVVVAVERRVDPTLQADLGRPALPCLDRAPDDLVVRDEVRRAPQVRGELPFRERAEPAPEV